MSLIISVWAIYVAPPATVEPFYNIVTKTIVEYGTSNPYGTTTATDPNYILFLPIQRLRMKFGSTARKEDQAAYGVANPSDSGQYTCSLNVLTFLSALALNKLNYFFTMANYLTYPGATISQGTGRLIVGLDQGQGVAADRFIRLSAQSGGEQGQGPQTTAGTHRLYVHLKDPNYDIAGQYSNWIQTQLQFITTTPPIGKNHSDW